MSADIKTLILIILQDIYVTPMPLYSQDAIFRLLEGKKRKESYPKCILEQSPPAKTCSDYRESLLPSLARELAASHTVSSPSVSHFRVFL